MTSSTPANGENTGTLALAAKIVSSYVSKNQIDAGDLPDLIRSVYNSLNQLGQETHSAVEKKPPAVPIKKSITNEHIICLEDGKKLKMLKRYLRTRFGLTPDEYRRKWGLPANYPMVAPAYAKRRSEFAKQIGLGRGVGRKKK
jgi:predicted transcriptional regulator